MMLGETTTTAVPASTLVDLLAQRVDERPNQTAFVFLDESDDEVRWTYADLAARVDAAASTVAQQASTGERAILVYPPGLDFVAAFLGCLRAGVLPVPATYPKPRRPLPRLDAIAVDCSPTVALTTSGALATMDLDQQSPAVREIPWLATDQMTGGAAATFESRAEAGDPAFLQYTSGSTSDPRGVVVSHANLMHNLELIRQGFGLPAGGPGEPGSSGVFWLPAYHDMGLIGGVLTPIYIGGTSHLIAPTAFLRRPLVWLDWLSRTGATISGAPNFAYDLCVDKSTPADRAELDLSRWEIAFCGAEPVSHATLQRFAEAFAPAGFRSAAFYPCYGLAEATLMVSGGDRAAEPRTMSLERQALAQNKIVEDANANAQTIVGCGRGLGDQQLQIVDHHTRRACPERAIGEIWVRGGSIASRYWNGNGNDPFNAELAATNGTPPQADYLRTGDLGFLDGGELFVTGRLKDVIIIRGCNHYPQDIERTAQKSHPGVDMGAAFAVNDDRGDALVVVHQVDRQHRRGDLDELIRAIRTAIVEEHELNPSAIVLIQPASLPLTSSGKVQRSRCREMLEAGELNMLADWRQPTADVDETAATTSAPPDFLGRLDQLNVDETTLDVQCWMLNWLASRLSLPAGELSPDVSFAELGVDSLTSVELALEFEDVLGLRLEPAVALSYPTPGELSQYLAEQLKDADASPSQAAASRG